VHVNKPKTRPQNAKQEREHAAKSMYVQHTHTSAVAATHIHRFHVQQQFVLIKSVIRNGKRFPGTKHAVLKQELHIRVMSFQNKTTRII